MADVYTERSYTGCLGNILGSIVGAFIGVILFLASFVVIWMNEGRVDVSRIARDSVPLSATTRQPALEGRMVAASGALASTETLGDKPYLKPGRYLVLESSAEMYAWQEKKETHSRKEIGGGTTQTTTYTYTREWMEHPEKSSDFRHPEGHQNPTMALTNDTKKVSQATLGAYQVDMAALEVPERRRVPLDREKLERNGQWQQAGDYLVDRAGALNSPKIGDLRLSYQALPNPLTVTLFGKMAGDRISPYTDRGTTLYRAFTEDREGALARMHGEYKMWLWIVRGIGFLMMWIGLALCWSPLTSVLDVVPALGNLGGCLAGLAMFGVALVLWTVTLLIAIVAHNIVLLLAALLVVGGGAFLVARRRA